MIELVWFDGENYLEYVENLKVTLLNGRTMSINHLLRCLGLHVADSVA